MGRTPKSRFTIVAIFRPIFTVVVLSAFVLGISLLVKTVANSDSSKFFKVLKPVLAKLNIDEVRAGVVAGEFVSRLSQTGINDDGNEKMSGTSVAGSAADTNTEDIPSQPDFTIAFLADSHDNNANLTEGLEQAKSVGAFFAFLMGDITNYGETPALQNSKKILDGSDLEYLILPGDHDLYKSIGPQNFIDVFGKNHFVKVINGIKFVGMDNSANYTVINNDIMSWFDAELVDADFVLLSQPLYHPSFNVVMGVVGGEENVNVRAQALELLSKIRDSNVKAIIAADQHISSINVDPNRETLNHVVVGALTDERNLQTPRFSIFNIYADGTYQVEDVLIK